MANTKITNPELFNLGDSTSATQLPVMTTTERIAMTGLSVGEMIFNSTTDKVEYFDGTKWYGITYAIPPLSTTDPFGDGSQLALYQFNGNANNTNGTNNGIVSGSGGYTTGKFGQAINITGATTSYVWSLKPPTFNQSICYWVDFSNINFNANPTTSFRLTTSASSTYNFWNQSLFYQLSSDKFWFATEIRNSTSAYNYRGTGYTLTNVNKTGWNFIVFTFPNNGNTTYSINNSTIATAPAVNTSGTITSIPSDNQIGRIYSNGSYFSGSPFAIDQYRLFNKTLSQSEINTLYTEVV